MKSPNQSSFETTYTSFRGKSVIVIFTTLCMTMVIYISKINSPNSIDPIELPRKNIYDYRYFQKLPENEVQKLPENKFHTSPENKVQLLPINKKENKTFRILLYNPVDYMFGSESNYFATCSYKNCMFTKDTSNLRNTEAILYVLTAAGKLPNVPPISPADRNPDQIWIFGWLESPVHHHSASRNIYMNEHWRNTVNWTMSYTYDADIWFPYEMIRKKTEVLSRNYSEIFHKKTRIAAWAVSNCNTHSKRELYVNQLKKYGVQVDIFGACGNKRVDTNILKREINEHYKFYLSFENSLCKDYITEKFLSRFELDTIIVGRSGGDYGKFVEENTFINTADFKSAKDVAKFMLSVASNETLYIQYMKNKSKYESVPNQNKKDAACKMCSKLNNLGKNRRTYSDLVQRIHKDTCFKPKDLS